MNPILEWALQILLELPEPSLDDSAIEALARVGIDVNKVQVNHQPLHAIFSAIGEPSAVCKKRNPLGGVRPARDRLSNRRRG